MSANSTYQKKSIRSPRRGFSLVELIVVISIFSLITGIILTRHSQFNSSLLLSNLAYEVALSIREAQVFGLSSRQSGSTFDLGYGVHFDSLTPASYIVFADLDRNNVYTSSGDAVLETYTLQRAHAIGNICVTDGSGSETCVSGGSFTQLDIGFERPDPDAYITVDGVTSTLYGSAKIILSAPQNNSRTIRVVSTGQISVEQ